MAEIIYLDNAATTFPKPREVLERMIDLYAAKGVSPGRENWSLARASAFASSSGVTTRIG
jgi:cysteine desulfurase/selenocysteine lyase